MSGAGFRVVSEHSDWHDDGDHYAVLFRAAGTQPPVAEE